MDRTPTDELVNLMRMEYLEMPDLKLTFQQARRLWDAPSEVCLRALDELIAAGFLVQSRDGRFLRRADVAGLADNARRTPQRSEARRCSFE